MLSVLCKQSVDIHCTGCTENKLQLHRKCEQTVNFKWLGRFHKRYVYKLKMYIHKKMHVPDFIISLSLSIFIGTKCTESDVLYGAKYIVIIYTVLQYSIQLIRSGTLIRDSSDFNPQVSDYRDVSICTFVRFVLPLYIVYVHILRPAWSINHNPPPKTANQVITAIV